MLSQFTRKGELIECAVLIKLVFRMPIAKSVTKAKMKAILNHEVHHTKKPDVDNLCKAVLDAMNGIILKDDSQVYGLQAYKWYSQSPGIYMELITE